MSTTLWKSIPSGAALLLAAPILAACATQGDAVRQTRLLEEELERVDVVSATAAAGPAAPAPEPAAVALSFDPSSATLDEEARTALDGLAERLATEADGWYLEVRGHADGSGSEEANLKLGRARAEAVRSYLHEEKGVPLDRLGVVSLGSSAPVADDGTPEGRSQNRRAEVLLLR